MSYCRWSCLNGYCDVYVYEDVHGGWTTHVAARRRPAGAVADEFGLIMASGGDAEHPAMKLYMEQHRLAMEWAENNEPIALAHEEAGSSFNHGTPGECADNLERLRREGFIVPQWAIDDLRAEQAGEGGVKAEDAERLMKQRAAVMYPTDAVSLRQIVDDRDREIALLNELLVERAERIMELESKLANEKFGWGYAP